MSIDYPQPVMLLIYLLVAVVVIWRLEVISNKLDQARLAYFDGYQKAASVRQKPYKLIIAGNYGQFQNWCQTHIIRAYAKQHLVARDLNDVEFIKVGDWANSEALEFLQEYMTKEQWGEFLNAPVC